MTQAELEKHIAYQAEVRPEWAMAYATLRVAKATEGLTNATMIAADAYHRAADANERMVAAHEELVKHMPERSWSPPADNTESAT